MKHFLWTRRLIDTQMIFRRKCFTWLLSDVPGSVFTACIILLHCVTSSLLMAFGRTTRLLGQIVMGLCGEAAVVKGCYWPQVTDLERKEVESLWVYRLRIFGFNRNSTLSNRMRSSERRSSIWPCSRRGFSISPSRRSGLWMTRIMCIRRVSMRFVRFAGLIM